MHLKNHMHFIGEIHNNSFIKNSLYLIATYISSLVLGFFFWLMAARYYTPDDVGTISALLSGMLLIAMISSLGFQTALVYYLPRDRGNAGRILNSCIIASIAASFLFSSVFIYGLDIWARPLKPVLGGFMLAALFTLITTASTVSALVSAAFIAGRRSSLHMTKETLFSFLKILPLPLLMGFGAVGIFLAWGIGIMLAVILGFVLLSFVWKGYFPVPAYDPIIKSMAGYSIGNYLAGIFNSIPRYVLPVMIVNMINAESTGFFFIAMTVAGLLHGIPQSISSSLLAESSESGGLWDKVGSAIRFNFILLFPGVLLFILFGKFVLNLFNPSYAQNAFNTLIILAIASIPMSVITIFTAVRNAEKRVRSVVKINASIAIFTLALAVPLMKSYGIEGAAAAFLATNTIAAIVVVFGMKNLSAFISKQTSNINKGG